MKNIIAICVLLLIFSIPKVTHAAWWNPFTWFTKQVPKIEEPVQNLKEQKVVQSNLSATTTLKTPAIIKEAKLAPVAQKAEAGDITSKQQQEISDAKKRVEEQLRADLLKVEIEKQVRLELERIKQAEEAKAEEERQALLRAEEEKNRITINVGESFCSGSKLVLPYEISGPLRGAVIRVYSENGTVDIRSGINSNLRVGTVEYGSVSDLKAETSGYGNPNDNPYLNGSAFHFDVEVYDRKHTDVYKKVVAKQSGDMAIPTCQ